MRKIQFSYLCIGMLCLGKFALEAFSDGSGEIFSLFKASSEWLFSSDSSCLVVDSLEFCSFVLNVLSGLENILKHKNFQYLKKIFCSKTKKGPGCVFVHNLFQVAQIGLCDPKRLSIVSEVKNNKSGQIWGMLFRIFSEIFSS